MSGLLRKHLVRDFRLERGAVLPEAETAYITLGTLAPDGLNAVLITHGYTTGPSMLFSGSCAAEGSWSELVGPGKPIDTDRYFVVCANALGSAYGSTGPRSTNPRTGLAYGGQFPEITMADIVILQKHLMDDLGVRRLAAVAGPSMGGFQAFEWSVRYPSFVERCVAAVSSPFNPAVAGGAEQVRQRLAEDPAWADGRYVDTPGSMVDSLTAMRVSTLTHYGLDADLKATMPAAEDRDAHIRELAREWAEEFDAGSLVTLMAACENFDVRDRLSHMTARLLIVISRTDGFFSPALAKEVAPAFDAAGLRWSYVELDSEKGHIASGADAHLWAEELRRFMQEPPSEPQTISQLEL